jgi:hypothetical protein
MGTSPSAPVDHGWVQRGCRIDCVDNSVTPDLNLKVGVVGSARSGKVRNIAIGRTTARLLDLCDTSVLPLCEC